MLTFPHRTGPAIVDWVDYADAVHRASPQGYADAVIARAGPTHHIWLVWQPMYQTFGVKCETIATDLLNAAAKSGGGARNVVTSHPKLYYEPMNLTEFATSGS
jgi:hypothetical protein